jgi:hypothetical protein
VLAARERAVARDDALPPEAAPVRPERAAAEVGAGWPPLPSGAARLTLCDDCGAPAPAGADPLGVDPLGADPLGADPLGAGTTGSRCVTTGGAATVGTGGSAGTEGTGTGTETVGTGGKGSDGTGTFGTGRSAATADGALRSASPTAKTTP